MAAALAPEAALACGVCFSPQKNSDLLLAYYGTTALLTGVALGLIVTGVLVIRRHYANPPEPPRDPRAAETLPQP